MAHIEQLISEKDLYTRIKEMGRQITEEYAGKAPHMICILKGGSFFMCDLARAIDLPVTIDFMSVSSYGSGTESSGIVRIIKDLDEPLLDKDVIIVEDIIDTGNTLKHLYELLLRRKPASLKIATLLDKPERRQAEVDVSYVGFTIPDEFIVGCGLDWDQKYRTLPYIAKVCFDD